MELRGLKKMKMVPVTKKKKIIKLTQSHKHTKKIKKYFIVIFWVVHHL